MRLCGVTLSLQGKVELKSLKVFATSLPTFSVYLHFLDNSTIELSCPEWLTPNLQRDFESH